MGDKNIFCISCNEETDHMDMGMDIPDRVRYKCKKCGEYNDPQKVEGK